MTKKIAINTGGGDAPGLNAVIRAATVSGRKLGWEMFGIREGYRRGFDDRMAQGRARAVDKVSTRLHDMPGPSLVMVVEQRAGV